ncbi:MAG: hypothetical protein QM775_17850 [Pirellulales bacterium]
MNAVLGALHNEYAQCDAALHEIMEILDDFVEANSLTSTVSGYFEGAALLRDAAFPTDKLARTRYALGSSGSKTVTLKERHQAIGIMLIPACFSDKGAIQKGAQRLFDFMENQGFFPEMVRE